VGKEERITHNCYFFNLNFPGLFLSPWCKWLSLYNERTLNCSHT